MSAKCRQCGAEKKENVEWLDDTYCSGKCKSLDGGVIPQAHTAPSTQKVTLIDYKQDKKHLRYRRRFEPERLNWGEPMSAPELKQAGLRSNRKPIPGDWDFIEEVKEDKDV